MFERAILAVQDEPIFTEVIASVDAAFSPTKVDGFLHSVGRSGLRVRQFEAVLAHGLLGKETPARYGSLGDADRGQVREQYLARLEQVAPELRKRYLKIYAYY